MNHVRLFVLSLLVMSPLTADENRALPRPTSALVLPSVTRGGRSIVFTDALEATRLAQATGTVKEGDEVKTGGGASRRWTRVEPTADGTYQSPSLRGGYLRLEIASDVDQVVMLQASGHTFAAINGEPRSGDPYGTGWLRTPILLRKGTNELLFICRGATFKPILSRPSADVFLTDVDLTLPDIVAGARDPMWLGVRIINATTQPKTVALETTVGSGPTSKPGPSVVLPPLSQTKLPCSFIPPANAMDPVVVRVQGTNKSTAPLNISIPVRQSKDKHRRTFLSAIDGSVQYYAVVPAQGETKSPIGLTLTLHGAGVEASGQAACFEPKPWTHVVAATNRRPFGFDWEDWGRLDALEVLADADGYLRPASPRRWLTGHSMGGHGTWHLGAIFPDRFAAIGPSAGWVSMFTYAGMRRTEETDAISAMMRRATLASDTFALANNLKNVGVFILHGDKDDNVPVSQARMMRETLAKFHADWVYREQPGAGHWWGNACVDWAPMFQFFDQRSIPDRKDVRRVEFATASPGVSADCYWVRIEAQVKPWELSSVAIDHDPAKRSFRGKTTNVARLALDTQHMTGDGPISVELDGGTVPIKRAADSTMVWLARDQKSWKQVERPLLSLKGPHRNGGFKDAFRNRVQLVYATGGTPEENAWALAKARFDAESFYYRGNASFEMIADTEFDPNAEPDRNVILYGHALNNRAWKSLLGDSPVQVSRGKLSVGGREITGDGNACLFVRPRPGSDRATVGVVAGTGLPGLRLTDRLPYFVSGVGIPDLVILDSSMLTDGAKGIVAAGYFGNDWSVELGEVAWR